MWEEILKHFHVFIIQYPRSFRMIIGSCLCFTSVISISSLSRIKIVFDLILALSHFKSHIIKCGKWILYCSCGSYYWLFLLLKVRFLSFKRLDKVGSRRLNCGSFGSFIPMIKITCIISSCYGLSGWFHHMIGVYR